MHHKKPNPLTQNEERQTASYERKARKAIEVNLVLDKLHYIVRRPRKKRTWNMNLFSLIIVHTHMFFTHFKLHKIYKRMALDWTCNSPSKNSLSDTPPPCKPRLIMLFKQLGGSKWCASLDSMGHKALDGSKEHRMKATPFPKIKSLDFNTSYTIH